MELWKGQPKGRYSLFLYQTCGELVEPNNEVIKMGCAGLAWLLPTDDDEYLITFASVMRDCKLKVSYMRIVNSPFLSVIGYLVGDIGSKLPASHRAGLSGSVLWSLHIYARPCIGLFSGLWF